MTTPSEHQVFAPLEDHCYLREATLGGIEGFALMDSDGEVELFAENSSDVFYYINKHKLKFVFLN